MSNTDRTSTSVTASYASLPRSQSNNVAERRVDGSLAYQRSRSANHVAQRQLPMTLLARAASVSRERPFLESVRFSRASVSRQRPFRHKLRFICSTCSLLRPLNARFRSVGFRPCAACVSRPQAPRRTARLEPRGALGRPSVVERPPETARSVQCSRHCCHTLSVVSARRARLFYDFAKRLCPWPRHTGTQTDAGD